MCSASILVVAIVGIASASNTGVPAPKMTTQKAPYSGDGIGLTESFNFLCTAGTKILKFPEFNTTTGKASSGGNATATSCPYPPGPKPLTEQELTLISGFVSSNLTGLKGLIRFETHLKLSFSGNLHVHSGGKGQFAEAFGAVEAFGYVYNGSSNTDYNFTESVFSYQVNTTTGTDVPIKVSNAAVTLFLNITLSSKYVYNLYAYIGIGLESAVSLSGSSVADSEIQMYGSGEGATLTSYSY